jgi:hypothetical protein
LKENLAFDISKLFFRPSTFVILTPRKVVITGIFFNSGDDTARHKINGVYSNIIPKISEKIVSTVLSLVSKKIPQSCLGFEFQSHVLSNASNVDKAKYFSFDVGEAQKYVFNHAPPYFDTLFRFGEFCSKKLEF